MLNLLPTWLVLFGIVLGWGLSVRWLMRRFGGRAFAGAQSLFQIAWLGYAGLLAFLESLSLILPIANLALVVSIVPAIAGYAVHRDAIRGRVRLLRNRRHAVLAATILLATLVVAYVACDQVQLYDTGLYHLQAVKWSTRYPAVIGLANLHQRFGYNNSVHLFAAYTDALWEGVAVHVANGFVLLQALAQWLTEIFNARTPRGRVRQAFCLVTLPYLLLKLWGLEVASLSTDLPLTVFSFALLLELLTLPRASLDWQLMPLATTLSLAAIAATTKLGGMALFVVAASIAVLAVRRERMWKTRIALFSLPGVVIVAWMVRGVIESGWLIYPAFGRIPVSWAVPTAVARDDLGNIESWARMFGKGPDEVFGHGFWYWFGPWLEEFRMSHEFILLVVACALIAWSAAEPRPLRDRQPYTWVAVLACLLALAQWFTGAPSLRYGGFLFWLLLGTLVAPLLAPLLRDRVLRPLVVMMSLAFTAWAGGFGFHQDASLPRLFGRPPPPRHVPTTLLDTGPGTAVLHPDTGDQCFDAPLPCTPFLHQTRRDPRSLGGGYLPL